VAGGWRRLHNEELHNLYASPNIIRVIKLGGACCMQGTDEEWVHNFGRKNLKGRDLLENVDVDGRIILEWILEKPSGNVWTKRALVNTVMNLPFP